MCSELLLLIGCFIFFIFLCLGSVILDKSKKKKFSFRQIHFFFFYFLDFLTKSIAQFNMLNKGGPWRKQRSVLDHSVILRLHTAICSLA